MLNNSILEKRQEGTDRSIEIWYRPAFDEPVKQLVKDFSRNAAMVFSEVWKRQLERSPDSKVLMLKGANTKPYERILNWINMCIDEGNDVKFPDVSQIRP